MSDEQPRPRYGEYAPGYVPGQTPSAEPTQQPGSLPPVAPGASAPWSAGPAYGHRPPERTRNTADVVVTIVLLVLGLGGMLIALVYGGIFANPTLLDEAMRQQGRGSFQGDVGAAPTILILSHVVLYLLALGLSVLSLVKKRITFWIPLVIGVVAAAIFWTTVFSVLLSDPSFAQRAGL